MARIKCRPVRIGKSGRKTVRVKAYRRSTPKAIRRPCRCK